MGSRKHLTIIRQSNRAKVMTALRKNGSISRVQAAKITGLSLASVVRIVNELIADGVLIEVGIQGGGRGRPMVMLDINPDGAPVAGIRLGPESIPVAVFNPAMKILAREEISYKPGKSSLEDNIETIAEGIESCCKTSGKDPKSLAGVGIGAAGPVDSSSGTVHNLTNRRGWENVPIAEILEKRLGIPVFVDNDNRAAAVSSQWLSKEHRESTTLYVYFAEGVGGAIVQGKDITRGFHDMGGLIGHMTMNPEGPLCGCGNRGCLETLASDIVFIRYIWPEMAKTVSELKLAERKEWVIKGLKMAKNGDAKAAWALVTVAKYLGIGIANAISLIDPQTIFIYGTMIDAEPEWVTEIVRNEILQHVCEQARGVEIVPILGFEEFHLRGAAGLVLWQEYHLI